MDSGFSGAGGHIVSMSMAGSIGVIKAVAEGEDMSPKELPPLNDVIDPDALDKLFQSSSDGGLVKFEYYGYDVTYHADGKVELEPAAKRASD